MPKLLDAAVKRKIKRAAAALSGSIPHARV